MRGLLLVLLQMLAAMAFAQAQPQPQPQLRPQSQAALVTSLPADDAVLQHAPGELMLRFNQAVTPLLFKLLLPDGSVQPVQAQRVSQEAPGKLRIGLPLSVVQGTYLLSWRVASADGKPVGGALTYSLGFRSGICVTNEDGGTASVTLGAPVGR
jgi:copper transport protein